MESESKWCFCRLKEMLHSGVTKNGFPDRPKEEAPKLFCRVRTCPVRVIVKRK